MAEVGTSEKQANSNETKAFLSIVLNEPWTEKQKALILEKVTSDLKTWIQESSKVDLEQELNSFLSQDVKQDSDNCATYVTDNFELNILYNPSSAILSSSIAKLKNAHYAHFIYSGVVLQGSGDWPLKEETYTSGKFASEITALGNKDLELVLCAFNQGKWTQNGLLKKGLTSLRKLVVNPDGGSVETPQYIDSFASYVQNMLVFEDVTKTLEASNIVGNIRFNRPTLYIFPAGEGDSAFFGISGFTFMANGGYSRQSCFWPFVKHLDRIDALLVTHLNSDNLFGVNSMLEKKLTEKIHPDIGTTLFNAPNAKTPSTVQTDSLYVNMADVASGIVDNLSGLNVNRLNCLASKDITKPLNLYQKLGYGSLDLYVLNPQQDSKEIKDFLSQWSKRVDSFSQQKVCKSKGKEAMISLTHLVSVSVILVWRPASPKDNIVRILFPGNCPQNKLLDSLEKLKSLDIFKKLNCTEESLTFKKPTTTPPLSSKSTSSLKTDLKKPPPVKDTKPEVKKNIPPKETKPELKKSLTTTRDSKTKIDRTTPAPGPAKRPPLSASKSMDSRPTTATSKQVVKKQQTVTSATTVSATPKRTVEKTTKAEPSKRPPVGRAAAVKPKDKLTKKEPVKKEKPKTDIKKASPREAPVSKEAIETESPKSVEQPPLVMNGDPAHFVQQEPENIAEAEQVIETKPSETTTGSQEVEQPKTEPQELVRTEAVETQENNSVENMDRTPADGSGDPGSIDNNETAKSSNENGNGDNVTDEQKTDIITESIEPEMNDVAETVNIEENVNNGNGADANKTDDTKQETIGEAVDVKDLPTEMTASLIGSLDANDNKNEKPTQLDTSLPEGVDPPMSLPPPPPKATGRMSIGGRPLARSATVADPSSRSNSSRMSLPPRTNGASFAEARRNAASFNVDLAYIPCHGDPNHVDSAFFSKIKAKHYVLSSLSPSRYILDAFLDGLTEGEDEIQLIPTYDTPIMRNWIAVREDDLRTKNVKIAPSASRCGIQLQDNEIGCPAFRLEF
ncbi:DgyrCDS8932 [Dimorphilus gyrociliatus]|uniref:DgyrCDS8932 n=1 Tax=Dimorphilus gyrociliatus TaxID=2664684 RepID=A0A7I8VVJ4_9ANNE|nr:DgyrCDS8932 [Dimorphilus gyrociliatus]